MGQCSSDETYGSMSEITKSSGVPSFNGDIGFKVVEAQVGCGQHLGQHDNLSGVHREVLRDVEDGFEEVDVVALDFAALQEN
jgi:hypothetical protein